MIATCVPLGDPVVGGCLGDLDWIAGIVTLTR
jgi:hypothetical protein